MVTEPTVKTGYWRIDPATGKRDWIEGSYQPKKPKLEEEEPVSPLISSRELYEIDAQWEEWTRAYQRTGEFPEAPEEERFQPYYEQWKVAVAEWEVTQPPVAPVEEIEPVRPEVPAVDVTALARQYGLATFKFVSSAQLADLALPPEERRVIWRIPFEQYLTWEQARYLGLDVPEGSIIKMTPMAEGEPSFFLMSGPEIEAEQPFGAPPLYPMVVPELEQALRTVYPEMFDPAMSYGYSLEEIPSTVIQSLQGRMQSDFQGFVDDLYARVGGYEAERILKLFGVTEEFRLQALTFKEQELRVNTLIGDVLPDFANLEQFGRLLETDFDLFVETIQTGGSSLEKRSLLEVMGYKPEEINQILSRQRLTVDVDGISQLLTIDIETQAAYDDRGNYVGKYNPATREFTQAPQENILKNFWDWTMFQSRTMWEQGENFFLSVMPNIVYPEMPKGYMGGLGEFMNETNRQQRENFRFLYNKNKADYEDWVRKHPELVAPVAYQEGAYQHPELLKDPKYYAYELANIMPFILAATGMALATGGVGLPAVLGTAGLMAPVEGQAVYEDLINAGAPEGKAAPMAAIAGAIIGLLESAGRIPLLKSVSPLLFGKFKRLAWTELARKGLYETVKRFGRNFTLIHFSEVATEVSQEVVSNVAVGFFDENRTIVENLPDIAVKTAVATLLPAGFGAGVSVRMVKPSDLSGLSDAAKRARGWIQDEKGNWFAGLKKIARDERGFVRMPLEPEEIRPKMPEIKAGVILVNEEGKRLTAEKWLPEAGLVEKGKWLLRDKRGNTRQLSAKELSDRGYKIEGAIPITEPGMPEAGLQPSMLPEEVTAREVRPEARAEIVQISMEDQLKLDQARHAAEEASAEDKEAYEAQEEVEGLKVWLGTEPATRLTSLIKRTGWYKGEVKNLTLKQYRDITGKQEIKPNILTKDKKHVMWEYALDDIATELGYADAETLKTEIERAGVAQARIKELEVKVKTYFTEKPLAVVPEQTTEEATANLTITGQPVLTTKQITRLLGLFGKYVESETAVSAWELTRELRRETRSGQAENLKARTQELIISEGLNTEEAMDQAIRETMAGELPTMRTDYLDDMTSQMRDSLFAKVYHTLKDEPFEMMSTVTALTNALLGRSIPRQPGPTGRSAFTRLQRVFGDQPIVFKAIEKMAVEKKPLEDVVEGIYHEIGREPIPIDQESADYLRGLSADVIYTPTRFREPIPVAKYEAPIERAIKEIPLWPIPVRENVVKVLKELGMLPIDIGNFLRANKASVDFSFWRQQAPLIANHPITFIQANVEAWKAIWSQKSAEASWIRITKDPLYQIYEFAAEAGGDFLRPLIVAKGTAQYKGTEEFGFARGVERLLPRFTIWLPHIKISARAFETGTNEHNWLIFRNYYKAMLKISEQYASGKKKLKVGEVFDIQKEMIDFSKSLANFTARGSLGRYQIAAPALSSMFFAPRHALGRVLSVKDLINANPRVRAEAWKNAATFVGTLGGIILLGAAAGWWEVERDPLNAEYMSIRIGNVRVDPWGGFRQFLVFFARAITKTGVSSVTGAEYTVDPLGLVQTLLRGKAAPLASLFLDFWRGKNFIGEEVDVANKKQWAERIAPFAVWDIYEAYEEDPAIAAIIAPLAIVGAGVQTYTGDWVENWMKLGLPKYSDNFAYGLTEPYYDTADFWTDTSSQFKGVDPATLTKEKGFPEYIRAIAEARIINEHLVTLPNEKLVNLNADPVKGTTFAQYRQMWKEREKLVAAGDKAELTLRELQPDGTYKKVTYKGEEALKAFDQDERTRNANLGNFSQRQFALLNEYWAISDPKKQSEFLEKHETEIGINPRHDWLRSHPKESAQLAVWGQAKILTKEAYTEFNSLIKSLDIPDNAIAELTLPPEGSVDNYFEREQAVQDYGGMSAEAMIVLARDPELQEWYGLEKPEQPERYYELKIKNRVEREYMETLKDKDSPTYIKDEDERREDFLKEFPDTEYFDDERRTEAIANGFTDSQVEAWAERGRLVDKYSGGSPKVKEWAFDNPEAYAKALEEGILEDKGGLPEADRGHYEEWVEPAIRLQSKNMKEDAYWKGLGDKSSPDTYIEDEASRRKAFFERFPKSIYFDDLERIEAYKAGFTSKEAELWAARGRLIGKFDDQSAEAKIWLVDHDDVWKKAIEVGMLKEPDEPWNVPALRITATWRVEDDEYDAIKDPNDRIQTELRDAYLVGERLEGDALAKRIEYAKARRRREAYELKNQVTGVTLPEDYVETFVSFKAIELKGKRGERFIVENPGFAEAMFAITGQDMYKIRPEDVPAVQYDDIYDENKENFDKIEAFKDADSLDYKDNTIEDPVTGRTAREQAVYDLRFDKRGKYTEFGLAELRRNAYGKFVPEQHVESYVGYYKIEGEGKPKNWKLNTGTDLYYEDDWYMMEHIDFYREVYRDLLGNEKWDFTKVPSREVFSQYLTYIALPHLKAKDDFRGDNPELDAWLVLKFGYTPIAEKKRREALTPYERFIEEWEERGKEIEERLKALRE